MAHESGWNGYSEGPITLEDFPRHLQLSGEVAHAPEDNEVLNHATSFNQPGSGGHGGEAVEFSRCGEVCW